MKTVLCFVVLGFFAVAAMADGTVTGTWSGSFNVTKSNGETKDSTALLKLTQMGSDITGTVGPSEEEQFPIQKGKIEGDKITLEADHDGQTIKFNLVLAADRITGEANMSHGDETAKAKLDLKRVK
jgi:hypothetical protein